MAMSILLWHHMGTKLERAPTTITSVSVTRSYYEWYPLRADGYKDLAPEDLVDFAIHGRRWFERRKR